MRIAGAILVFLCALAGPAFAQEVRGLAEAREAFERNDFTEAYVRYSSLVESPARSEAEYSLSIIHAGGFGVVPANDAAALELLRSAANANYAPALTTLGLRHYEGAGVPQNRDEGLRLWRRAAALNDGPAMYSLGLYYLYTQDGARDYVEGERWMRLAADAGESDAFFELGRLYDQGRGVERDLAQAVSLTRRAAAMGHASARVYMVEYYFNGEGVPRDIVRAEMWALIADRAESPVAARGRAVLQAQLTQAQREEAAALADECIASPAAC